MMIWRMVHPKARPEMLGYIPGFLSEDDPRPAREQFDSAYQHGGGWTPFHGFTILPNGSLKYPDDPPMVVIAETKLRDETIRFHECSWVSIIQPDGTYEICRMD